MNDQVYTYTHPRPIMAADSVVFTLREGALNVLLIRRGHDPFEGHWALPGGFVNEDEPLDDAAARELREETGLVDVPLRQLRTFGDPGRDPRGWAVSAVYWAVIDHRGHPVQHGDDAAQAEWFPVNALPPLAFDHDRVLEYALNGLCSTLATAETGYRDWPKTYTPADVHTIEEDTRRFLRGR
jgi:8-oxo-dGTP diphosphatase